MRTSELGGWFSGEGWMVCNLLVFWVVLCFGVCGFAVLMTQLLLSSRK